jgi:hypothetical protein
MLRILDYVVEAADVGRLLAKERGIFLEGLVFVVQFLLYGIVPRVVGVKHHVVVRRGHVGHCHGVRPVRVHFLIAH